MTRPKSLGDDYHNYNMILTAEQYRWVCREAAKMTRAKGSYVSMADIIRDLIDYKITNEMENEKGT